MDDSSQQRLLVIALSAFVVVAGLVFWSLVYQSVHQAPAPVDNNPALSSS